MQAIGGPVFLLLCVWLFTHYEHGWWPTLLGVIPSLLLGYYLWRESPGLWRRANLDAMYQQGKLSGYLGEHTLEIREDGLLERNAAGERLSHWGEIENVYTTSDHTFFVTRTQVAYVLPRRSVLEGDYDQFIEAAQNHWKKASG
jgi:hypothetical protein